MLQALNRIDPHTFRASEKLPIVVVLDRVRSLYNVGSIFRTSDAFRIEALYLCGYTGTPPHRDIQKTALGATESVVWQHYETTELAITHLKDNGYKVYAVEQTDESVYLQDVELSNDSKIALVFGNEVEGVADESLMLCDAAIEIPQFGTKHSFNITISVGIVLWELSKKLGWTHSNPR